MAKKIFLYIDSMQMGGAQRVMNNISDYMVNQGYDVTLINDIIPQNEALEYCINKKVYRLFLDKGSENSFFKNINRIRILRKFVIHNKPDVILSFLGPPNIRMLLATVGLKCRKIVSVRNDPLREYGKGIKKVISRILFRLADGCIFQTEDAANFFSKKVQRRSKIIFNPVNDVFFEYSWTGVKKEIAVVGRLQQQKNPLLALEAFYKIEKEFPEYKIVYYGDDELKDEIIKKSIEYGIEEKVIIYGKSKEIWKKLQESTLFLLSSDYEGMPNSLLEAMAVGIPVISTNCPCGGPRTIIENNTQGLLVKCGDSDEMADGIRSLLCDCKTREAMSQKERERANDFKNDKIMLQWESYLFQ